MSSSDHHDHSEDEKFRLKIEVPRAVREDPVQLQEWLNGMAVDLMNAENIDIHEDSDQSDADTTDWVKVTMYSRPCPGRVGEPGDGDDDGDDGDMGGDGN